MGTARPWTDPVPSVSKRNRHCLQLQRPRPRHSHPLQQTSNHHQPYTHLPLRITQNHINLRPILQVSQTGSHRRLPNSTSVSVLRKQCHLCELQICCRRMEAVPVMARRTACRKNTSRRASRVQFSSRHRESLDRR